MVQLTDTLTLDTQARICADGCLVADVFAARTGLQDYLGREADPEGKRFAADAIVKVYRPESEVFKADSLATFAAAPVTVDHPSVAVDASNWRQLGVGEINGDVVRDGQRVRVPIIVRDAAAVRAATTTHKQLSMGYATELVFPSDGKHPDGTACDAYQTNLRINHIALVRAARGGPELRVVDERPAPLNGEKPVKTMLIDGLTVDIANADTAQATITTIIAARDEARGRVATLETQVATLTTEASTKDAKITTLEQQVKDAKPTPAQLREAGKAIMQAADKAKALGVTVSDEMDEAAIMAATVAAKMGDAAKEWTADQIAASFAVLTKDAKSEGHGGIVNISPARNFADGAAVSNSLRHARYA